MRGGSLLIRARLVWEQYMKSLQRGFTLIELMIVVVVIGRAEGNV